VSFLKKLLGTTAAMADARSEVPKSEGAGATPHGWNVASPDVEQTDSEVILRMGTPGLDASSVGSSVDGDTLVLKASRPRPDVFDQVGVGTSAPHASTKKR
jgi:HSP20 family molecular chaperone IbpA